MVLTGKTINELPEITGITSDAEFVVEQAGTTYKIKGPNITSGNLYGSFYSNETQGVSGTIDDAYVMSAETTSYSVGFDVEDNSKFISQSAGTYNIQFSSQLSRLGGTSISIISVWLRVNGIDIEDSRGDVYAGINVVESKKIIGWNFLQYMEPNDYFEIVWSTTNSSIIFQAISSETEPLPAKPGSPSIAITITQV